MIIEDFVMLGRTVPENSKKYGHVVCSAGYSVELGGLIRIYPLLPIDRIPKWTRCRLHVCRNKHDSRFESWKLINDHAYEIVGTTSMKESWDHLLRLRSDSIKQLNSNRASLGIISPTILDWRFQKMASASQLLLFDEDERWTLKKSGIPYCTFLDDDGKHCLQLREWGNLVYLNKFPENPKGLWDNLRFNDESRDHLFLVGNMSNQRTTWLVISTFQNKRVHQKQFDFMHEFVHKDSPNAIP